MPERKHGQHRRYVHPSELPSEPNREGAARRVRPGVRHRRAPGRGLPLVVSKYLHRAKAGSEHQRESVRVSRVPVIARFPTPCPDDASRIECRRHVMARTRLQPVPFMSLLGHCTRNVFVELALTLINLISPADPPDRFTP